MYSYCRVVGCCKPARAGTSDGLDEKFCRSHADHHQRHGSPYKGTYLAEALNPYRKTASRWLRGNLESPWVKDAIQNVESIYRRAGPHVEAFRLRGLSPQDRAKAAWARLRKAEADPLKVVAAWLAVEMIIQDDPQPVLSNEFKRVQAAKIIHRMASGTHKRWETEVQDPAWSGLRTKAVAQEMHIYPRSRGRVLRYIGGDLGVARGRRRG